MMKRFSKMRPGLLVPTMPVGFRSIASRRSTRPLLPTEGTGSRVFAFTVRRSRRPPPPAPAPPAVVSERSDRLTVLPIHGDDVAALQVDEPAVGSIGTLQ